MELIWKKVYLCRIIVNDKTQPDVCICLAKLAELSALFLAARRNFTKFCDVISWIFPHGVLYQDSPLRAGKRPKLNYCVSASMSNAPKKNLKHSKRLVSK